MWEPEPVEQPTSELDPADWDPRDPSFRADPFPWYRALRQKAPVYGHEEIGIVLSRYDDIVEAARDWQTFSSAAGNMIGTLSRRCSVTKVST